MKARLAALFAILASAAAFFALGGYSWLRGDGNVEEFLTGTGAIGPVVFVLVMWGTQPLGVPGLVYMAPAGVVWSWPLAVALAWVGNMGASYLAFAFARWFGRDWVTERIPAGIGRYADRISSGGVWSVVLLRLLFGQLPPADWLLGVTKVTNRNFLIGTGIGIIPGVIVFVVVGGSLFEYLGDMSTSTRRLIVGAVVAIVISRRVRRRMRRGASRRDGVTLTQPEEPPVR